MDIHQFNSKIISITQLRRDIDALEKVLTREEEAVVMRNQNVLFVAVTPDKYQKLKTGNIHQDRITEAIETIKRLRETAGKKRKGITTTEFIIKMRDERVNRWKK